MGVKCNEKMLKTLKDANFSFTLNEVNLINSLDYNNNPVLLIGKLKKF
jgi:hypothetical protein